MRISPSLPLPISPPPPRPAGGEGGAQPQPQQQAPKPPPGELVTVSRAALLRDQPARPAYGPVRQFAEVEAMDVAEFLPLGGRLDLYA